MDPPEIEHKSGAKQHLMHAKQSPDGELVIAEGTFESAEGGFNSWAEMLFLVSSLGRALPPDSQVELLLREVVDRLGGWLV